MFKSVLPLTFLLMAVAPATVLASVPVLPATADIREFPLPMERSRPQGLIVGPDDHLWFTGKNKISKMTLSGVTIDFPLPAHLDPSLLTWGNDGNVWFTGTRALQQPGRFAGIIGRMTPAGDVTEFQLPSLEFPPFTNGITSGPDGNLWFTAESAPGSGQADFIGKASVTGRIELFSLPTQQSRPGYITVGSDGALWFTQIRGNRIGRITTEGSITEFALPTSDAQPTVITLGADGRVWFTESGAGKIGAIATDGTVSEIDIHNPRSYPFGISTGPDGNVWFTFNFSKNIGTIRQGVMLAIPLRIPSTFAHHIVAGPDDNIWFDNNEGNTIGKLDVTSVQVGSGPPVDIPLTRSFLVACALALAYVAARAISPAA